MGRRNPAPRKERVAEIQASVPPLRLKIDLPPNAKDLCVRVLVRLDFVEFVACLHVETKLEPSLSGEHVAFVGI